MPPMASLNRLVAIAMPMLVALLFVVPWLTGFFVPGFDQLALARIMQVEFIVVALGAFLIFVVLTPVNSRYGSWIRRLVFTGFAIASASAASQYGGLRSVINYAGLVYVTFGSAILSRGLMDTKGSVTVVESFVRWISSATALFGCIVFFEIGSGDISGWTAGHGVLGAGAIYFFILASLEATVYRWIDARSSTHQPARK